MARLKSKRSALAVPAAVLAIAGASTALADVTVYNNDFGSRAQFEEVIRSGGGKGCERRYREKSKSMLASVQRGKTTCSYRPPVQGDTELPNHIVRVDAKILSKTSKPVRGQAFVELTVRAGGGGVGYSLRVYPQKQRFELLRNPGGSGFPVEGRDKAINKIDQRNQLRLAARGATITASVNGKPLASLDDANPGAVPGTKIRFGVGNGKQKSQPVIATFKQVTVAVP